MFLELSRQIHFWNSYGKKWSKHLFLFLDKDEMHECIHQIYFFQGLFFFFKLVITMLENELLLVDKSLNLCNKMQFKHTTVTSPYLLSRRLVEEDIRVRSNGTDLDSNLGLCLLNYRGVPKKNLWRYFTRRDQNYLKIRIKKCHHGKFGSTTNKWWKNKDFSMDGLWNTAMVIVLLLFWLNNNTLCMAVWWPERTNLWLRFLVPSEHMVHQIRTLF